MSFLSASTQDLVATLKLNNQFSGPLNKASRDLTKFDAQVAASGTRAFKAGQQIGNGIKNAAKIVVGATALMATAVAAISVKSLDIAGDFEAHLNTINTIARTDAAGLKVIGTGIRQIAKDTGTSLDDLTSGYYDLLSAGIKAADAQKVLNQANQLAIGGLGTTAEAVDLLTTAINTYGGDASKAATYTDVFAKAVERGKVTTSQLAASFSIIGPLAASSGISIQEIGAGFARLTASGVPAAEAATQMRSALVALTKTTKPLEALETATKKNYAAIASKQGLVVALQQMRTDADKAGIPLIKLLGRIEGVNFTLATTGPNFKAYNTDLAAMGDAAGTAAGQMAERQQGLNFQLARLKALATDAGITIGSALLPKIVPLIAKLNDFVSGHQSDISAFGDRIAALFSDSNITEGGKILTGVFKAAQEAAPAIAEAARLTGQVVSQAVGLFRSLPPEIQALAITGLAVNKLTGGIVTNIAGGLISAVLKQLVSGVVNVNGAVVNVVGAAGAAGGIPAGNVAAAAGGASFLSTIVALAAPIAAVVGLQIGASEAAKQVNAQAGTKFAAPQGFLDIPTQIGNLTEAIRVLTGNNRSDGSRDLADFPKGTAGDPIHADLTSDTMESLRGKFADALKTSRVFDPVKTKATIEADRKARGIKDTGPSQTIKPRLAFLAGGHKGSQDVAVADALALGFERNISPAFKKIGDLKTAIKALQADQGTVSRKSSGAIGKDIARLQAELARRVAAAAQKQKEAQAAAGRDVATAIKQKDLSVTVPVTLTSVTNINGRQLEADIARYKTSTAFKSFGNQQ